MSAPDDHDLESFNDLFDIVQERARPKLTVVRTPFTHIDVLRMMERLNASVAIGTLELAQWTSDRTRYGSENDWEATYDILHIIPPHVPSPGTAMRNPVRAFLGLDDDIVQGRLSLGCAVGRHSFDEPYSFTERLRLTLAPGLPVRIGDDTRSVRRWDIDVTVRRYEHDAEARLYADIRVGLLRRQSPFPSFLPVESFVKDDAVLAVRPMLTVGKGIFGKAIPLASSSALY